MNKKTFIHSTATVEEGAVVGEGTQIWHHCHVRSTAVIGKNCNLGKNVYIDSSVVVGDGVKIQNNVSVYQGVVLEDDVFVGPSVVFTNDLYPRAFESWNPECVEKTLVCKGASLGANSSILCGVTIGEYAMVGLGSVIVESIKAFELWVGNPAKMLKKINKSGRSQL